MALIKKEFPHDSERMIAIATCESNLNPEAKGPTHDGGVFQIHIPTHGKRMESLGLDVWNPEDNIAFAKMLYEENGIKPWVCAGPKFLAFNR